MPRLRRPCGLKLKPLPIVPPVQDAAMIAMILIIQTCLNLLRHMTGVDVQKLFTQIPSASDIKYRVLGRYAGRLIVFVESIVVDGIRRDVNLSFFRSSGFSRDIADIKGVWFPCTGIVRNPLEDRILKLEDSDILLFENSKVSNEDKVKRAEEIGVYGRFITELYAIASKALYALSKDNPAFDEISNDLVLDPNDDFVTLLDSSYVNRYYFTPRSISLCKLFCFVLCCSALFLNFLMY